MSKTTITLAKYSTVAAGLVAPVAGQAAIVYTEANLEFGFGTFGTANFGFPMEIDFDGLNGPEFEIVKAQAWAGTSYIQYQSDWADLNFGGDGGNQGFIANFNYCNFCDNPIALESGDSIGPAQSSIINYDDTLPARVTATAGDPIISVGGTLRFFSLTYEWSGPVDGEEAFIGVTFQLDATGTQQYFGWIGIEFLATGTSGEGRITGWAYEDSGAAIAAGDTGTTVVPIPATLPLLASGFAGLAFLRNRQRKARNHSGGNSHER